MKRLADLKQISKALALFYDDNGIYPTDSEVLGDVNDPYRFDYSTDTSFLNILTPYISNIPRDPINSGGDPWSSSSRIYAYGATEDGEYYLLMTQLETPNHPESVKYKCNRWTGGWPTSIIDARFGKIMYSGCCPPSTGCTVHNQTGTGYVINSDYP